MKQLPKNLKFFIPRITFKDTSINIYLVYTLVVFAFLLGMLTNKVMYLEKIANAPAPTAAPVDAGPTPPPVVKDMKNGKLPILGNKDAKVTIVEFSDFQCPFCKSYFDDSATKLNDAYIKTGKVKFAYRHYPLITIHPNAQKAAEASECANEQGKFWEFHDILFKNQTTWSAKAAADAAVDWESYAGEVGMIVDQFTSCLTSEKYKKNVDEERAAGDAAQVNATPTFFINGVRVVGAVPFEDIKAKIDEELKK